VNPFCPFEFHKRRIISLLAKQESASQKGSALYNCTALPLGGVVPVSKQCAVKMYGE
jgi:hypothetical protein